MREKEGRNALAIVAYEHSKSVCYTHAALVAWLSESVTCIKLFYIEKLKRVFISPFQMHIRGGDWERIILN